MPPVAGGNVNDGFVDELHGEDSYVEHGNKKAPADRGLLRCGAAPSGRRDADGLAVQRALGREAHFAVDQSEQRVVLSHANVSAGVELRAAPVKLSSSATRTNKRANG